MAPAAPRAASSSGSGSRGEAGEESALAAVLGAAAAGGQRVQRYWRSALGLGGDLAAIKCPSRAYGDASAPPADGGGAADGVPPPPGGGPRGEPGACPGCEFCRPRGSSPPPLLPPTQQP